MSKELRIITGNANRELAEQVCADPFLDCELTGAHVGTFPGGEICAQIDDNIRGGDVFIIQSVCENTALGMSPNDALMELVILIDAAKRSSARRITAVLPYYGYARQDRKDKPRVPITAKLVANMLMIAGADRILTLDLHANQIQGFFDVPVDHIYAIRVFMEYLRKHNVDTIASPDAGNMRMARGYADPLRASLIVIDKRRENGSTSEVMHVIGEPEGKRIALVDDVTSTGGTLADAATALMGAGAKEVRAIVVHPVFAVDQKNEINCIQRLTDSPLSEVIVSNSIPLEGKSESNKVRVISIAPLLAEAISHIHLDESISGMFRDMDVEG